RRDKVGRDRRGVAERGAAPLPRRRVPRAPGRAPPAAGGRDGARNPAPRLRPRDPDAALGDRPRRERGSAPATGGMDRARGELPVASHRRTLRLLPPADGDIRDTGIPRAGGRGGPDGAGGGGAGGGAGGRDLPGDAG